MTKLKTRLPIQLKSVYTLVCRCGHELLKYKKNTDRPVQFCCLDQIINSADYYGLHYDPHDPNPDNVKLLFCRKCHAAIGLPVLVGDQIAFRLRRQFYTERKNQ